MFWKKLFGKDKKTEERTEEKQPEEVVEDMGTEPSEVPQPIEEPQITDDQVVFSEKVELDEAESEDTPSQRGFFRRLKEGLSKTRKGFVDKVEGLITGRKVDDELFDELEEVLIQADCGVPTAIYLVDRLRTRAKEEKVTEGEQIKEMLQEEIINLLSSHSEPLKTPQETPYVIMVVGVNGAGKTTTIGKLAYRFKLENAKVLLGAGDTFRAAAIDQLQVWADRVGVELISHQEGSDPAALAFDAVNAAKARKSDVLILDTAGRLQTKSNLMAELGKVHRVVTRELGRDIDEVLLVVDATTGQNALSQGKLFSEAVPLTGVVLTKLDGTAKGGIVLALANELNLSVKLIGVGEQYTDLQDFDPHTFSEALFD